MQLQQVFLKGHCMHDGWTKSDVSSWIVQHLAQELHVSEQRVAASGSFVRLALDSLQVLDLLMQLEQFMHCEIPLNLLYDHRTVDSLAEALMGLGQRRP